MVIIALEVLDGVISGIYTVRQLPLYYQGIFPLFSTLICQKPFDDVLAASC